MIDFNARDYGFGSTQTGKENTVALQKAVDGALASGSGTVVILNGEYEMEGPIIIGESVSSNPSGLVRIVGCGRTKLVQTTDEPVFVIGSDETEEAVSVTIENLYIQGDFRVSETDLGGVILEEAP